MSFEDRKALGFGSVFKVNGFDIAEEWRNSRLFGNRGFSDRIIKALTACAIDGPERLLFMDKKQLAAIPGIGKTSLTEIMKYKERFGR